MTELRTDRLTLRRARAEDLQDMHEVLRDEEAMRYWSHGPHATFEETEDWLRSMIESPPELSDDFVLVTDGRVIGKLGAWRLPEFGFILRRDCMGRGYASEAMSAFLPHVFARTDVPFLMADVDPRNSASLRLLARFGFRETHRRKATWNTHIGVCDSIYLRLDRTDWAGR